MGQQEYDNFKRLIREWLDSHPDEYAAFVEEMNDKEFKGFVKVFKVATTLVPRYKEATRRRIGDDKISDFEELENVLLDSDLAKKKNLRFRGTGECASGFRPCQKDCERVPPFKKAEHHTCHARMAVLRTEL